MYAFAKILVTIDVIITETGKRKELYSLIDSNNPDVDFIDQSIYQYFTMLCLQRLFFIQSKINFDSVE